MAPVSMAPAPLAPASRIRHRLAALVLGAALSGTALTGPALAQDGGPATLLADRVTLSGGDVLTAEGAVEMFHQGRRLSARRVIYNGATGQLTLEGPIRLTEPGDTGDVLIADQALLDDDLRNGILTGARLVLAREMQLAARQITRSEGRYTVLDQVAASSCQVCASDPTPLWEIRAARVVHDAETRRLTFSDAHLRAFGLPILWLPRLTVPDPTVDRARGLLRPSFSHSTALGFGVSLPYFIPIGDHHDLTLTPLLTTKGTRSLGLRSRHALSNGTMEWSGALTRDDLRPGDTRGYVFANGSFALPRGYRLGMQVQAVSDRGYLSDYNISDADRLWSGVTLDRVRRDRMVFGALGKFHTLRAGEANATQPGQVAALAWERRFHPAIGGEGGLKLDVLGFRRPSDTDGAGRDMARFGVAVDWRRQWLLPAGILAATEAALDIDHYRIGDDPDWDRAITRVDPRVSAELRWPWMRAGTRGATDIIEPMLRIDASRNDLPEVPNEDSRLSEFDEANLFAPARFAGQDARETGTRIAAGLGWTRLDPAGWQLGVAVGRIWRQETPILAQGSILGDSRSDWLVAAHFAEPGGLRLSGRALVDDDGNSRRAEARVAWANSRVDLAAGYLWQEADPYEGRDEDLSELVLDSRFALGGGWQGALSGRYDFDADRVQRAGLGLSYVNECVTVDLSLSHRLTASTTVKRDTDIGLSVRLTGFGSGGSDRKDDRAVRRRCTR